MTETLPRRRFLRNSTALLAAAPLASAAAQRPGTVAVAATPHPAGSLSLNVRDFGAAGDGTANDTAALQRTIDRCAVLGGGEVRVPAGRYSIGGLALRSRVTLRLEQDAVLAGRPEPAAYPVTEVRWEGKWIPGHIGLLHAIDAEDVAIVGPGHVEGNQALGGRPTKDDPLRHPALIEFINCRRIRLEGFSTSYFHMWSIHPCNCDDITIQDLTIRSTGGNGDGIDIDSCRRVLIRRCDISTGDDCISLKSGRGEEAFTLLRTTEDVQISDCTFADAIFACIGIGSETSGGIRRVRIENCRATAAATHALYIKSRVGRGAFVEDITVDGFEASAMKLGFLRLNQTGSGIQDQNPVPGLEGIPLFRNLVFRNLKVHGAPLLVQGTEISARKPLDGFTFESVTGDAHEGIKLVNTRRAVVHNVKVAIAEGPLLRTANVQGTGLAGAQPLEPGPDPAPVDAPAQPYRLG